MDPVPIGGFRARSDAIVDRYRPYQVSECGKPLFRAYAVGWGFYRAAISRFAPT